MHIVILGCGRVGSTLAHTLEDSGHTVAVIDRAPEAFRRLRSATAKHAVTGLGHDREVLVRAGIETAHAFAAVSSGDNSNIIAARVARETFGVRNVVARIYDPRRAEVYQRLGIPTVATVRWTADMVLRHLVPGDEYLGTGPLWRDPSGTLVMTEAVVGAAWSQQRVDQVESALGVRVTHLSRGGEIHLARSDLRLWPGDVLHVVSAADATEEAARRISADGGER
ncbi:TrkA family potassium uptake protein [Thermobifida halotolerans]|uniref:Trk system potassium uptake protein TrkA n=1 Tax=Thermobifida halotolerans TaxID=483545 RepID=A0A399G6U9_9ACTN|nr:TrkA family potassium uptake protein [Thermobifida halotolerans]UOE21722.1 TrkA family potassium uptake protein [Thermobifida halotolerans]